MPETPRPSPSRLSDRARHAAAQRRADTAEPATWRDPHWAARAEECAHALARVLNIGRDQITVEADRTRAYGRWCWPRLTVTEPDGTAHVFVAAYSDTARLLALGPCPVCGQSVPIKAIGHLADLGDLLAGRAGQHDAHARPLHEFYGDPGHRQDCPRRGHD